METEELAQATGSCENSRNASRDFRRVIPPKRCEELHLLVIDALQLMERGWLSMVEYMQNLVSTGRNETEPFDRAYFLLAEADKVKERSGSYMEDCHLS